MKNLILPLLFVVLFSNNAFGQKKIISPDHNTFDSKLIKAGTSKMTWYMLQDTLKIEIGKVNTEVSKKDGNVVIITKVEMKETSVQWTDTTVAKINTLKPVYHSSFNQQRDMVLNYDQEISGYYLDKKTNTKTSISEQTTKSYFDSNIYPQLIRWLPLKDNYTQTISIFDYNPNAETGVITATIKKVTSGFIIINEQKKEIWKVSTTDDISDNKVINTFFIEKESRKLLKHDIDMQGRKMSMELTE